MWQKGYRGVAEISGEGLMSLPIPSLCEGMSMSKSPILNVSPEQSQMLLVEMIMKVIMLQGWCSTTQLEKEKVKLDDDN